MHAKPELWIALVEFHIIASGSITTKRLIITISNEPLDKVALLAEVTDTPIISTVEIQHTTAFTNHRKTAGSNYKIVPCLKELLTVVCGGWRRAQQNQPPLYCSSYLNFARCPWLNK
ncbi:unnamed protein product, partial [Ceratitis capitata]